MEDVRSDLNTFEQLINLLVRHLLTKLGENISQLSSADITVPFLIKDLESTDKLLYDPKTRADQQNLSAVWWTPIDAPGVPAGLKPSARFKIAKKLL